MTFADAIRNSSLLTQAFKNGLQALSPADCQHVVVDNTRQLAGSLNLEDALRSSYPNPPIWDYGIGHRRAAHGEHTSDFVYWLEVHPATDGDIEPVLRKLTWLKSWLEKSAPALAKLPRQFVWVSSGKTAFTQRSPQAKRMAEQGLLHVGSHLRIKAVRTG